MLLRTSVVTMMTKAWAMVAVVCIAGAQTPEPAIRITHRAGLPARAAAMLVSGQTGGDIALSILAVPVPAGAGQVHLDVVIDINAASLVAGSTGTAVPVEVAIYATGTTGGVVAFLVEAFVLEPVQAAQAIARGGIKLLTGLDVPPSPLTVRVLVRRLDSAVFGIKEVKVVVPGGTEPFLAPPVVEESGSAWLLAWDVGVGPNTRYPLSFGSEETIPATRPVLVPGVENRVWLLARGLHAGLTALTVGVAAADGRDSGSARAQVLERSPGEGLDIIRASFTLPMLAPGNYTLNLAAPSAVLGLSLESSGAFVIAAGAPGEASGAWVNLVGRTPSGLDRPETTGFSRLTRTLQSRAELRASYLMALSESVADGPAAMHAAVATLEAGALQDGTFEEAEQLKAAETDAADALLRVVPASGIALLRLHFGLYRQYVEKGMFVPRFHARQMVEQLATMLTNRAEGPETRLLAADAISCVALDLQQAFGPGTAEDLLRKALQLDPTNAAALEGLGAALEGSARFTEALAVFSRLVEQQPDNAEARLRVAVNLQRVMASRSADRELGACVTPDNPDWVRVVAYQELVKGLIAKQQWNEAGDLLKVARVALPVDSGLAVQEAFVLDRSRRQREVRPIVNTLATQVRDVESPRYRYCQPSTTQMVAVCQVTAERAPATILSMGRALRALSPGRGQ